MEQISHGVSEKDVLNALKTIIYPDFKKDIVSLGFIKKLSVEKGSVSFDIELTTPACPVKDEFKEKSSFLPS